MTVQVEAALPVPSLLAAASGWAECAASIWHKYSIIRHSTPRLQSVDGAGWKATHSALCKPVTIILRHPLPRRPESGYSQIP